MVDGYLLHDAAWYQRMYGIKGETPASIIAELKTRSKSISDLVVTEHFTVTDVLVETHETTISPLGQPGGYWSRTILQVAPENPEIPVTSLNFQGLSAVTAGQHISAKIPRSQYVSEIEVPDPHDHLDRPHTLHLDRPYRTHENAIELVLMSEGHVLRRERSTDYSLYLPEQR